MVAYVFVKMYILVRSRNYTMINEIYGDFKNYKKNAIKAAKELKYGMIVVARIKAAKTEAEIQRIMVTERHKRLD